MHQLQQLADFLCIFEKPVVILDLETTGGDWVRDRITEVAFLHFHQGCITPVSQLIQPQQSISPFIERLTGISNAMVADAPLFADFLPHIQTLLRGSLIIAHNSRFDYAFLRHETHRAQMPLGLQTLCSVQLSRRLYPEFHKHSLDAIIERHGLQSENRHRAMSDVLNLAHFLQVALAERGEKAWLQHAQSLLQPNDLPKRLPANLRSQLENLPDSYGVSVWYNAQHEIQNVFTHEMAYREMPNLLRREPNLTTYCTQMAFYPAVGNLHTQFILAQLMQQHALLPNEISGRHSIVLDTDPNDGCLKARIRQLKSGFHHKPPHGLFFNPKAAKRALVKWSKENNICPTQLGILPDALPKSAPCPVSLVSGCVTACTQHNSTLHNTNVYQAQHLLPVCDWGKKPRVVIRETDAVRGISYDFVCDSGALQIGDLWYISTPLLNVLKQKFKQSPQDIQVETHMQD